MTSQACGARISANGSGTFTLDHVVSGSHPGKEDYSPNCTWYIIAEDPGMVHSCLEDQQYQESLMKC